MTQERKTVPMNVGFSSGFKDAAKPSPDVSNPSATQKLQVAGDHTQAGTGKMVSYKVDLDHGAESTNYAARVLLQGARWHELEAGTVTGPDRNARTQQVSLAVSAQIDQLDFDALNKG